MNYKIREAIETALGNSSCGRRKIACVLLDKSGKVLSAGYNSPHGVIGGDCSCEGKNIPAGTGGAAGIASCKAVHAEEFAIEHVEKVSEIYACWSTKAPCPACVNLLLETGCREIHFITDSNDQSNKEAWVKNGYLWKHEEW